MPFLPKATSACGPILHCVLSSIVPFTFYSVFAIISSMPLFRCQRQEREDTTGLHLRHQQSGSLEITKSFLLFIQHSERPVRLPQTPGSDTVQQQEQILPCRRRLPGLIHFLRNKAGPRHGRAGAVGSTRKKSLVQVGSPHSKSIALCIRSGH